MKNYTVTIHLEDLEYEIKAENEYEAYSKAYDDTMGITLTDCMNGYSVQEVKK